MIPSISITLTAFASLALADNRVFGGLGNSACQACLAKVEAPCKGPISSSQFNDCFCDAEGDAWANLEDCLTVGTDCKNTQESILGYYGAHCFAWKDDTEEEFCIDASQGDALKMSIADSFCDEFITLSSSGTTPATVTEETSSERTTESEAVESKTAESETTTSEQASSSTATSEAEPQQSSSQDVPTTTRTAGGSTTTKSSNGVNNDKDTDDDNDDDSNNNSNDDDNGNGGSKLGSMSMPGLVILALWTGYMLSS